MAFPGGTIGAAAAAYAGYRLYSSLGNSSKRHDSRGRVVLVRLSLIAPFLTHYNYSPMRISLIRISLIRISLSRTHLSGVTSQSRRRQRNAASELRLLFFYLTTLSSECKCLHRDRTHHVPLLSTLLLFLVRSLAPRRASES